MARKTTYRERRDRQRTIALIFLLLAAFVGALAFIGGLLFAFVFLINGDRSALSLAGWCGVTWLVNAVAASILSGVAKGL